jgi:hypothetical protein
MLCAARRSSFHLADIACAVPEACPAALSLSIPLLLSYALCEFLPKNLRRFKISRWFHVRSLAEH